MLVLVATAQTQGRFEHDFCFTLDGELVTPVVVECHSPSTCGCGRGFPGLGSSRASTTALVVERPEMTPELLWDIVAAALERDGWRCHDHPEWFDELVDDHVDAIVEIATTFGDGTVVRRDGPTFWADRRSDAA